MVVRVCVRGTTWRHHRPRHTPAQTTHSPTTPQGENLAHAVAYGAATHYKASATLGRTRTFVGLYSFDLVYSIVHVSRGSGSQGCLGMRGGIGEARLLGWLFIRHRVVGGRGSALGAGGIGMSCHRCKLTGSSTHPLRTRPHDSTRQGWRIRGLKFTLKFMEGNLTLQ